MALRAVMIERGVRPGFGRELAAHLRARGLQSITAEGRMLMSLCGSAGADLIRANLEQLREAILATGMVTPKEFSDDLSRLDHPDFMTPSPIMWSVAGRRNV
jgi:hypothetical protein